MRKTTIVRKKSELKFTERKRVKRRTHQEVKILRNCARAKERKAERRGRLVGSA